MSDLTLSGPTLIYDLINAANVGLPNGPLSPTNTTLGVPAANITDASGNNTQVAITAISNQGYTGSKVVTYNRIDIGAMFTGWGMAATVANGATYVNASDFLPSLNAAYHLDLQATDIIDGPINAVSYPDAYTLNIAASSLTYIGTLAVSITA